MPPPRDIKSFAPQMELSSLATGETLIVKNSENPAQENRAIPMAVLRMLELMAARVPTARVSLETYDYGGTAVHVTLGPRSFELFCGPFSGNGVSETHDDTLPFTEHEHYFEMADEAAAHFLFLVEGAAREQERRAA